MKNRLKPNCDTWLTPDSFYNKLNERFNFIDFDPCPPECNLDTFNGLYATWPDGNIFVNPPYNRRDKEAFSEKALYHYAEGKGRVVLLLPVSTSTKMFHDLFIANSGSCCTVEFIKGRLPFEGIDNKGVWINPMQGRATADTKAWRDRHSLNPSNLKAMKRSGQFDSMLIIFGSPWAV